MPSKGKEVWNKNYYGKNADDILYNRKVNYKNAETISCPCGEFARYKDTTSARTKHFNTLIHKIYEKKQEIAEIMNRQLKYSKQKADAFIDERLEKKRARTNKDVFNTLMRLKMECIEVIDKPTKPETINVVITETKPIEEAKPHVPPSAAFDPLSMMGTSNGDCV